MDQKPNKSIIDEALDSYPLEPLPKGFVAAAMAKITQDEGSSFKLPLSFVDFAIPTFFGIFLLSSGWAIYFTGRLNPSWKVSLVNFIQGYGSTLPADRYDFLLISMGALFLTSFLGMIIFLTIHQTGDRIKITNKHNSLHHK